MSENTIWTVRWVDAYGDTVTTAHATRDEAEARWAELVAHVAEDWTPEELAEETYEGGGWYYTRTLRADQDEVELAEARAS